MMRPLPRPTSAAPRPVAALGSRRAPDLPRRTVSALLRAVLLGVLLLGLGAGVAVAQDVADEGVASSPASAPSLDIRPADPTVGDTVQIRVSGLEPSTDAVIVVAGPDGTSLRRDLRADATGTATAEFEAAAAAVYVLRLQGASGDALADPRYVLVRPASTTAGTSPTDAATTSTESDPASSQAGDAVGNGVTTGPQAPPTVRLDGATVVAERDGATVWTLDFPAGSGPTGALLADGDLVLVGHGLALLSLDVATGTVRTRLPVPAPVIALTRSAPNRVAADVAYIDGSQERLDVRLVDGAPTLEAPVAFGARAETFRWLEMEARGAADPVARLAADPTNPWLHVLASDAAGGPDAADAHLAAAVATATPFFDRFQIADAVRARGRLDLANDAVDAGLRDFAARGYTPELLTDAQLLAAYGAPAAQFRAALASGDDAAAEFWAPWAYRSAAPDTPHVRTSLRTWADVLAARGAGGAAALWRARANDLQERRVRDFLDAIAQRVAASGWLGVAALLLAAALVHLTLFAKYAKPQSVVLAARRAEGARPGPAAALFRSRYFTLTERLVGVLLLAAILAMTGLARWNDRASELPAAVGSGTLSSTPATSFLGRGLLDTPAADLARGYAAQVAGDAPAARAAYMSAGDVPAALNNLGALDNDPSLYQRALERAPGLRAAQYNLGRSASPIPFHERYRPGEPLLIPPSPLDLRAAVAGSWQTAVADAFVRPWHAFASGPTSWPGWLWFGVLGLFALLVVFVVVLLFAPRPRLARSAPRGWAYQLLALLVPGSGLADELYGILLILPWALIGADALLQLAALPAPLGLTLRTDVIVLAAIYAFNVVAWAVELVSYTRRMRDLKKRDPELARRFGLRVA